MKTMFKNKREQDRAERKAYRALDAMQDLVYLDVDAANAERAMQAIRIVITRIQNMEVES